MSEHDPSEPEALPSAELALLAAYRGERAMPGPAKARMISRLSAPPARAVAPRVVAVGVGLAAALALAFGVSALRSEGATEGESGAASQAAMHGADAGEGFDGVSRSRQPATPPTRAHRAAARPATEDGAGSDAAPPGDAEPSVIPNDAEPSPTASPVIEPPAAAEPAVTPTPRPRPKPRKRPASEAVDPPAAGESPAPSQPSQLSLERALLGRAWSALADGNHADALAATDEHRTRFAKGTLSVERSAITTIAMCKAKRPGWSRKASAFLDKHGKTPLARRVREACGQVPPATGEKVPGE